MSLLTALVQMSEVHQGTTSMPTSGIHSSLPHACPIALARNWRFGRPSPPQDLGVVTLSQATKQWPPLTSALAFHMNPRQIFLRACIDLAEISNDIIA
jgi:hypothetical protein